MERTCNFELLATGPHDSLMGIKKCFDEMQEEGVWRPGKVFLGWEARGHTCLRAHGCSISSRKGVDWLVATGESDYCPPCTLAQVLSECHPELRIELLGTTERTCCERWVFNSGLSALLDCSEVDPSTGVQMIYVKNGKEVLGGVPTWIAPDGEMPS